MKPINLKLKAFGPFVDEQVIDFTEFNDNQLFMITGKTGSGKSTIFDAICFALYGNTSIDGRNIEQLFSDFAKAGTESYVDFTWSTNNQIYRVVRYPSQMRTKKRGEGLLLEKSKLEVYHGDKLLESKINLGNQKIQEIVGIDLNQFRQIALLAQGEFKKLLLATSSDRELIFRKIFNTYAYQNIQEKQKQKTIELMNEIKEVNIKLDSICEQTGIVNKFTTIENFNNDLEVLVLDKKTKINDVNMNLNKFQKTLEILLMQSKKQDKYVELTSKLEKISQELFNLDEEKNVIGKLEKSITIDSYFKHLKNDYVTYLNNAEQLESLQQDELKQKKLSDVIKSKEAKKEKIDLDFINRYDELILLEQVKNNEVKELTIKLEKVSDLKNKFTSLDEINKLIEKQSNELTMLDEKMELDQKNRHKLLELSAKLLDLSNQLEINLNNKQMSNEYQKALEVIMNKKLELSSVTNRIIDNQKELAELERKYYKATSYLLAKDLADDVECPVCGSKEHPNLAHAAEEVDIDKINRIRGIIDDLFAKKVSIETEISQKETHNYELKKQINPDYDYQLESDQINSEYYQLNQEKSTITKNLIDYEQTKLNLDSLKTELLELNEKKQQIQVELANYSEADTNLVDLKKILTNAKRELLELQQVIKKCKDLKEEYQILVQEIAVEQKQFETINMQLTTRKLELSSQVEKFTSDINTIIEKYKLSVGLKDIFELDITQAVKQVENYKIMRAHKLSEQNLITKELEQLKNSFDLNLKQQIEEINLQIEMSKKEITLYEKELENYEITRKTILNMYENNKLLLTEYQNNKNIDNMLNGRNNPYISFERYILSIYFAKIIDFGNQRLSKLTDNRYSFNINSDFKSGTGKRGLDLTINDFYTGKERDVTSLSGGESFKASISLALGLSDVIRSENGGIELNCLFIDEGFGTLDEESLDQAIEVLNELQDDGRLIGIISHVNELKEQISSQIIVEQTTNGSYISIKK